MPRQLTLRNIVLSMAALLCVPAAMAYYDRIHGQTEPQCRASCARLGGKDASYSAGRRGRSGSCYCTFVRYGKAPLGYPQEKQVRERITVFSGNGWFGPARRLLLWIAPILGFALIYAAVEWFLPEDRERWRVDRD